MEENGGTQEGFQEEVALELLEGRVFQAKSIPEAYKWESRWNAEENNLD